MDEAQDKQTTAQSLSPEAPHQADNSMQEGVELHPYEESLHNYHSYAFSDTAAAEPNPLEEHLAGTKRPLETGLHEEEALHSDSLHKRYKSDDEGRRSQNSNAASTNKQWDAMFDRLVAFKDRNGHCLVPKRYTEDPKLGTWVETQRVQYKRLQREYDETSGIESVQPNKRLNQERLRKLNEIGFAWSAKHVRKQRNNSLQAAQSPPTLPPPPPMDHAAFAENPLMLLPAGAGVAMPHPFHMEPQQQQQHAVPPVPPVVRRKMVPNTSRLNDQQWEEMYQRLVRYKGQHGDCLVPRKYEADPKLSTWVETQRFLWNRDYRNAANASVAGTEGEPQDRNYSSSTMQSSLESMPDTMPPLPDPAQMPHAATFTHWTPGEDEDAAVVAAAAAAAAEAVDEEVDQNPPFVPPRDATTPRRLTKERKDKLDALGFVWSLRNKRIDDHWDEMFRQLLEYKEAHGDCLVPSRYDANLKLGKWVETQRYEYTKLKRAEASPPLKVEDIQEDTKPGAKPRPTNARLTEERLRRLESIGFEWKVRNKMKRYYDKQWQDMFDQLLDFKSKNGHTMVPKRYPDNPRLANWVHTQRIQYRKLLSGGKKESPEKDAKPALEEVVQTGDVKLSKEDEISFRLTEERRRKLEEIGFVWSVRESDAKTDQNRMTRNSYDDLWDAMYERLRAYKEKHGNCLVPKRSKEDPKLGTWVDTQRVQYKKMKKKLADQTGSCTERSSGDEMSETKALSKPVVGRLTEDRIRRLNDLGFVWSLRDDWTKHYDELKDFKKQHGHCNVPARYSINRRLGIWVSAQRQQYKQMQQSVEAEPGTKSTPLTKERIDLLNELGFTWTIRSRDSLGESWNQRLQELRQYKAVHGNCLVPSRYPPNPELGIWVGTQRTQYRLYVKAKESGQKVPGSSGMNEERIRQLEELGFVWALRGDSGRREDGFQQVAPNRMDVVEAPIESMPHPHRHHHHAEPQHLLHVSEHHNPEAILEEPSVMAAYQEHAHAHDEVHEV